MRFLDWCIRCSCGYICSTNTCGHVWSYGKKRMKQVKLCFRSAICILSCGSFCKIKVGEPKLITSVRAEEDGQHCSSLRLGSRRNAIIPNTSNKTVQMTVACVTSADKTSNDREDALSCNV